MSEIKVKPIHLRSVSQKVGMALGKAGRVMPLCQRGQNTGFKIADSSRGRVARCQRRHAQQPADQPDGTIALRLAVGPALSPFLAQGRKCRFCLLYTSDAADE